MHYKSFFFTLSFIALTTVGVNATHAGEAWPGQIADCIASEHPPEACTQNNREACDASCIAGNSNACSYLGCLSQVLFSWSPDALRYYKLSCESADHRGCGHLMTQLERSLGDDEDRSPLRLTQLLETACNTDEPAACAVIGKRYYFGTYGVRQDLRKAHYFLIKSCKSIPRECQALGNMYWEGKGVKKDIKKAVNYFRMACNSSPQWNPESCDKAGVYLWVSGGKSRVEGAELLRKSCTENALSASSCTLLCKIGVRLPKETEKKLYDQAIYSCGTLTEHHESSPGAEGCRLLDCAFKAKMLDATTSKAALEVLCKAGASFACDMLEKAIGGGP